MKNLEIINEFYPDGELLLADGFDDCIIGVAYDKATSTNRVVYSRTKCINILMERDGMEHDVAEEFFDFNVSDAYVGNKTPIFVDDYIFLED